MRQSSRDAAAGRMEVWVDNDTAAGITPTRITYSDPRFRTDAARHPAARPIPSQSERGFQILPARPARVRPPATGTGTVTVHVRRPDHDRPGRGLDRRRRPLRDGALPRARDRRGRGPLLGRRGRLRRQGRRPGHADPGRHTRPGGPARRSPSTPSPARRSSRRSAATSGGRTRRSAAPTRPRGSTSRSSPTAATTTRSWSPAARRRSRSASHLDGKPGQITLRMSIPGRGQRHRLRQGVLRRPRHRLGGG